jgi:hypothetical protein
MGAGRKTSSELPDDLWAAWKQSGASIPVLLREALEARRLLPDPDEQMRLLVREAVAAELDARGIGTGNGAAAKPSRVPSWPSR